MGAEDPPPLWHALLDKDFETAKELVEGGASLDDLIEEDGNTFLHDAAQAGDLKMVDFFLRNDCPLTLESFDYVDQTPLIRASAHGQIEVVVRLLSARIDPNANDEKRIGNTAIREAVRIGHFGIVELLLRANSDPTIPGWMNISAVDQAWCNIESDMKTIRKIRSILRIFPSRVRDRLHKKNEPS